MVGRKDEVQCSGIRSVQGHIAMMWLGVPQHQLNMPSVRNPAGALGELFMPPFCWALGWWDLSLKAH